MRRGVSVKKILTSRIPFLAAMVLLTILIGACRSNTYRVVFKELDRDRQIKPGTIAVIAGNGTGFDVQLAKTIGEQLSQDTVLTVLMQNEIARVVRGYPVPIMEQFDKGRKNIRTRDCFRQRKRAGLTRSTLS